MEDKIKEDKTIDILSQITFECIINKQELSNLLQNELKQFQQEIKIYYYDNDSHSVTLIIEDFNTSTYLKICLLQQDEIKIGFNSFDQIDAQVARKVTLVENFALYQFEKRSFENLRKTFELDQINEETSSLIRNLQIKDCLSMGQEDCLNLGNQILKCINLSTLYVDLTLCTFFKYQGCQQLADAISKCQFIREINLELMKTNLKKEGATVLGQKIAKCQNLSKITLGLQENDIGSDGLSSIIEGISQSSNLEMLTLYLQDNNIGLNDLNSFSIYLKECQKLSFLHLQLSRNKFDKNSLKQLAQGIASSSTLKNLILILSGNKLDDQSLSELGKALANNCSIQQFTTDFYQFKSSENTNQEQTSVNQKYSLSQSLRILNLDLLASQISQLGLLSLGQELAKCQRLTQLDIDFISNKIVDQGLSNFAQGLKEVVNLNSLKLNFSNYYNGKSHNNINSFGIDDLSVAISQLKQLQTLNLNLQNNKISSKSFIQLGYSISQCSKLITLILNVSDDLNIPQDNDEFYQFMSSICKCKMLKLMSISRIQKTNCQQINDIKQQIKQLENLYYIKLQITENYSYVYRHLSVWQMQFNKIQAHKKAKRLVCYQIL
ncbi:hypothetical protein ABPG74_007624 [Tetrahymena malaccensis]